LSICTSYWKTLTSALSQEMLSEPLQRTSQRTSRVPSKVYVCTTRRSRAPTSVDIRAFVSVLADLRFTERAQRAHGLGQASPTRPAAARQGGPCHEGKRRPPRSRADDRRARPRSARGTARRVDETARNRGRTTMPRHVPDPSAARRGDWGSETQDRPFEMAVGGVFATHGIR